MKSILSVSFFILLPILIIGQETVKNPDSFNIVHDRMSSFSPLSVKIEGYLGSKMDLVISQRIKPQ
jgi:hypothetical protein